MCPGRPALVYHRFGANAIHIQHIAFSTFLMSDNP